MAWHGKKMAWNTQRRKEQTQHPVKCLAGSRKHYAKSECILKKIQIYKITQNKGALKAVFLK